MTELPIYNILDTGAIPDGLTLNTTAIQASLDRVLESGGGQVVIPPGTFLTGSLKIHSHTELYLMPGAVLLGSPNLEDYAFYGPIPQNARDPFKNPAMQDRHLLLFHKAHGVTIRGPGIIDGNGEAFWNPPGSNPNGPMYRHWWTHKNWQRPCPMMSFVECEDLRFEGFTVRNSPGWTFELLNCDRVHANAVQVMNNFWGPNTDAFDICGCRDVMIANCHITCGDDAFCIKTMPHTRSAERITITNCTMKTNCVGLKLGCFESHKDMRQITFTNNVVYNSSRAVGIYNFKGATFEDIIISNLVCDDDNELNLNRPIHIDLRHETDKGWGGVSPTGHAGIVRRVQISNVIARTRGRILLTEADGGSLEQITLRDITLHYPEVENPQAVMHLTKSAQFSLHSPEAQGARAALVADGVQSLTVDNFQLHWPETRSDPAFSAGWFRRCSGSIDAPDASALGEADDWSTDGESTITIRHQA
jgi:polygalacturonase